MLGLKELTQRMWENEYAESSVQFADPVIDAPSGRYLTTATAGQSIEVVAVNGDPDSAVVTIGRDAFYAQMRDGAFSTVRLGSTIADHTAETLVSSARGLERVLGVAYQMPARGAPLPLIMSGAGTGTQAQQIGFLGPGGPGRATERGDRHRLRRRRRGLLRRDLVPHPLGDRRLPAQPGALLRCEALVRGDLRSCTARNVPSANPEYKRVWQFREFRKEPVETLRTALSRKAELDAYASDPFSPHAIARLRPGAYEKAMVMQYVDNLLDWGDSLFTHFTAESINEATMLYILALDILGPRALDAGDVRRRAARQVRQADQEGLRPSRSGAAGGPRVRDRGGESLRHRAAGRGPVAHRLAVGVAYSQSALEAGNGGIADVRKRPDPALRMAAAGASYWSVSGGTPLGDLQLGTTLDGANGSVSPTIPDGRTLAVEGDPLDPPMVGLPELPEQLERGGFSRRDLDTQPGLSLDDRSESDPGHHASGQREALAAARLEHRLLRPGQQGAPRLLGSRRGPSVQHPQLPRHRGNPPASRALRARDRPAAADQAEGGRPDPRRRPERHLRETFRPTGSPTCSRRRASTRARSRASAALCSPRSRSVTGKRSPTSGRRTSSTC